MWGSIATKKVKIGDLELTSVETLIPNGEVSERGVRGLINREIVYQVKGSSELLMFERNGWWHEAGISHPLLV